jgi:radical SAM superfamily enzyme YgiQ (UPF0313 family)
VSDVLLVHAGPHKRASVSGRAFFPTVLLTCATLLKGRGHQVRLLDRWIREGPVEPALDSVWPVGSQPALVVVEFATKEVPDAVSLADAARSRWPGTPIVAIGLHGTMYPRQVAQDGAFDAVVVGDPELPVSALAEDFAGGLRAPGVLPAGGGAPAPVPAAAAGVLDDVYPLDFGLVDIDDYVHRDVGFITGDYTVRRVARTSLSRGCAYSCTFCVDPYKGYSRLSNSKALEHLDRLVEVFRPDVVFFDDPEFFLQRRATLDLLSQFENRYDFRVLSTSRADDYRPDYINEELIQRHRDRWLLWDCGAETGNAGRLAGMNKMITVSQPQAVADLCGRLGVRAGFSCMVGMPGEGEAHMLETVRFLEDLKVRARGRISVTYQYYQPIGPTPMARAAENLGWRPPATLRDWVRVLEPYTGGPSAYLNPWLPRVDFVHYLMLVVRYVINEFARAEERDLMELFRRSWRTRSARGNWADLWEVDAARAAGAGYFPTPEEWQAYLDTVDPAGVR